ncbi:hypothetical protein GQ54DRAFT_36182 [Martensiomyces pterosporus]|nr:hypothetical protein GQ54DRAFT_36182 [Martensiomyces pterosporus]
MLFSVLFFIIILQLLASMGTFGALVAQNVYTNSAAGWYVRLDWTAVYTYVVTIFSSIFSFLLMIGGLTRGAPGGAKYCSSLFHPFALFVFSFIFSVLWVVIAGFAYRNPLPMRYPCDIFRHLRRNLEMLGLASGKSLVEEGGLLVGICQASKAFLVLTGIGLGLWVLILVLSCGAMTTGFDSPHKGGAAYGSRRSLRSVLTNRFRRDRYAGSHGHPPPVAPHYVDTAAGPAAAAPRASSRLAPPPPVARSHRDRPARSGSRAAPVPAPTRLHRNANTKNAGGNAREYSRHAPRKTDGYLEPRHSPPSRSYQPAQGAQPAPRSAGSGSRAPSRQPRAISPADDTGDDNDIAAARPNGLADPADAFASDDHEHEFSPRALSASSDRRYRSNYRARQTIDDEGDDEGDADDLDEEEEGASIGHSDSGYHQYSDHHAYNNTYHRNASHSPPHSQTSRRQRLRRLFSRDPAAQP